MIEMELELAALFLGFVCTVSAGNKPPKPVIPITVQGIVQESLEGHLICSVTYYPDKDEYKGVLINQKYEPSRWKLKIIDHRAAQKYYEKLEKINKDM